MPDNRVGHEPSIDAIRASSWCRPVRPAALTASCLFCIQGTAKDRV